MKELSTKGMLRDMDGALKKAVVANAWHSAVTGYRSGVEGKNLVFG